MFHGFLHRRVVQIRILGTESLPSLVKQSCLVVVGKFDFHRAVAAGRIRDIILLWGKLPSKSAILWSLQKVS
jgi:hypothetical protein